MIRSKSVRYPGARRGGAMVLVTIGLGVASVLAVSLLSSSAMQSSVSSNTADIAVAEYLAQSGISRAMYHLQNPASHPAAIANGYYPGESRVNLGTNAPGVCSTSVTYDSVAGIYTVTAVGTVTRGNASISRPAVASVRVVTDKSTEPPPAALVLNANLNVRPKLLVSGEPEAIRSVGDVIVENGATVAGGVRARSVTRSGTGLVTGATTLATEAELADVTKTVTTTLTTTLEAVGGLLGGVLGGDVGDDQAASTVTTSTRAQLVDESTFPNLRTYVWTDPNTGVTGSYAAVLIKSSTVSNKTLGPTADNPAGVYYTDADLTFSGSVTINGTLLVGSGKKITASGSQLTIKSKTGFPAMISTGEVELGGDIAVDIDGLTAIRRIKQVGTSTKASLRVRGAMLLSDVTTPIDAAVAAEVRVEYDAARANARGFEVAKLVRDRKIEILSWVQ